MAALITKRADEPAAAGTVCGYYSGDPDRPLTAAAGYMCTSDIKNSIWGICPTGGCGLNGFCIDKHACSTGCFRSSMASRSDIATTTCSNSDLRCGAHVLIKGPQESYEFIGCDYRTTIETLYPLPLFTKSGQTFTSAPPSTTPPSSSSSTPPPSSVSSFTSTTPAFPTNTNPSESTTTPPPEAGKSSTNIGAIVGGSVAGIFLICATVIGVLLIRRRRRNEAAAPDPAPPMGEPQGYDSYAHRQWDSSYGPVEMNGAPGATPAEMPAGAYAGYKQPHNGQPHEMPGHKSALSPIEMPSQGGSFR